VLIASLPLLVLVVPLVLLIGPTASIPGRL
jgi:hypothetical protein